MNKRFEVLFIILLSILSFVVIVGNMIYYWHGREGETTEERDTVTRLDTVYVSMPKAEDSVVVRYVTRWLPTVNYHHTRSDLPMRKDEPPPMGSDTIGSSLCAARGDSAEVVVPITQKRYDGDGYTAWISGYEARIDSIHLLHRTDVVTHTIYAKRKQRKWGCVVGIGGGMGTGGLTPHVGVTFGLRLF